MLQVRTLRQFLDSDQAIDCYCSNYWACSHSGPLRLEAAIQRLGWDFDFYLGREELAARTYCSVCGMHHPTFRLGWKNRPASYIGTHGAGMEPKSVLQHEVRGLRWIEAPDFLVGGERNRKFGPRRR